MRFTSNGPIIPDLLLEERDKGRVVFLCGAGVSIPAKMPTFKKLAQFVIEHLDPASGSEIQKEFAPWIDSNAGVSTNARTPLDHIFNLLQIEYGRDQVGKLVSKRLDVDASKKVHTSEHELIAKISSNQDGIPQIVTTNFDHLFEYAVGSEELQTFAPPTFPDLRHSVPVTGITYLHGRLSESNSDVHDYILSSSDFGRAYLSEGWATSFMRQLLKSYTVVLLGYQAEDPPVKYLLQGLNSKPENIKKKIYAFDQGTADEIETKWRDRGVISIAYPESDRHQALWDTLEAWAIRADSPTVWRTSIIELSQKGPQTLEPYERGKVAHLLRSNIGAKEFADTDPSPPIEWLLVFDKTCRYGDPYKKFGPLEVYGLDDDPYENYEKFDPLDVYGLDDDPPRSKENTTQQSDKIEDLISWRQGDDSLDHMQRLSGGFFYGLEPMSSRLLHLTRWMLKHSENPALAWWVARQNRLHPLLYVRLKRKIEDSDNITEKVRKLWMILFEVLIKNQNDSTDLEWFQVERRIKTSGWTSSVLRSFEKSTEPRFEISLPSGLMRSFPPINDWSQTNWSDIANINIHFPKLYNEFLEVPDTDLPLVFRSLHRNLIGASERLNEIDNVYFSFTTLYSKGNDERGGYVEEKDTYIIWFLELLERMVSLNPELLRAYIDTWPEPEAYLFDKFRLFVWNKTELFSGREVSEKILGLDDDQFWRDNSQREILFLLRDRWADFTVYKKAKICKKILNGRPPKYEGEDEQNYLIHKQTRSVIFFGWLLQAGCSLPKKWRVKYRKLKKGLPQWNETWINNAISSEDSKYEWVKTDEDESVFKGIPVDQIINVAQKNTRYSFKEFTEKKPFLGLVKNDPAKALSSLLFEAQRGKYISQFWNEIISNWPETAPIYETKKLYKSIAKLPPEIVFEIRFAIGPWIKERFPEFSENNKTLALSIFDTLIKKLQSNGPKATESWIGEKMVEGKVVDCSRKTIQYALNSPLGMAVQGLIKVLDYEQLNQGEGVTEYFKDRVELLLKDDGEGSDYTVCLLTNHIGWLNSLDPSWVSQKMIPWFDLEHLSSEPAWAGVFFNGWIKSQSVFDQIKDNYLKLIKKINTWRWEDNLKRKAYNWMVKASLISSVEGPKLTFEEVRDCLRHLNHDALSQVIWALGKVGQANDNGWEEKVIPFIKKAWPKERRFQTEKSSKSWVSLLGYTKEKFPETFQTVSELLRPIYSSQTNFYKFCHGNDPLTVQFPDETLDLLNLIIPDDRRYVPYDLSRILNIIVETNPEIISDRRYERLRELDAQR